MIPVRVFRQPPLLPYCLHVFSISRNCLAASPSHSWAASSTASQPHSSPAASPSRSWIASPAVSSLWSVLWRWTCRLGLSMLFHNFGSQILLCFLHVQYGTHRHTTQRLSQLFAILTGCKCDFYITSTCYLPQVSLNTN